MKDLPTALSEVLEYMKDSNEPEKMKLKILIDLWSNGFPISSYPWLNELKEKADYKGTV